LSAASSAVTFVAQGRASAVADMTTFTPGVRVSNALLSIVDYLGKTVWPAALAVYYPHPLEVAPPLELAGAALVLAGVSAAALALVRRRPFLAVGWFWFLGMLVPVIGIVQVGLQGRADRYTYLPLIGLFAAVAWCLPGRTGGKRLVGALSGAGAAILITLLAAVSVVQAGYWRDEETLYRRALTVTSKNWLVSANLGAALIGKGRFAEAADYLREAVQLQPGYAKAHNGLGVALAGLGLLADSEDAYRRSLALSPGYGRARYNLANNLAKQGRTDEAIASYRQALAVDPDSSEAHFNLANLLSGAGRGAEGIRHYREALRLEPASHDVMNNLAWAIAADPAAGGAQVREAVEFARRACDLTGYRNPVYLDTLAAAHAAAGDFPAARETSRLAVAAALETGDQSLAEEIAGRAELYRGGKRLPGQREGARR
jgi:tetratricopeptide (TPR) repeat protein